MNLWGYRVLFLAFALIIIYLSLWVSVPSLGGVHFQIDASNVSVNNTLIIGSDPSNITVRIIDGNVVFAKVGLQNIPTLINGITTSTSIIVAFSGGFIAYMLRELFQTDRKAKIAFFGVFFSFIYVFAYLFWVYIFLATGAIDVALRWSLDGLLLSLLILVGAALLGYYRFDNPQEKKSDKPDSEKLETGKTETTKTENSKKPDKQIEKSVKIDENSSGRSINMSTNEKEPDLGEKKEKEKREKKAYRRMYKDLHYENWQRGQVIWVVNSILITGSLLVAFQSSISFLSSLVAIMLIVIANILYLTTDIEIMVSYKKMSEVRPHIGLSEIDEFAKNEITKTIWYPFRKSAAYILFATLMGAYSFLNSNNPSLSVIVFLVVLLFNLIVVYYYLVIYKLKKVS
jgi:hypothetical protein